MPVGAAYLLVVLIWSTTPLGIKWSVDGIDPVAAAALRMGIALIGGSLWLGFHRITLRVDPLAIKSYFAASLGIFGAMALVYMGSTYVASGMISVLFGLSPILAALIAQRFGIEGRFSTLRWLSVLFAFAGLITVFTNELSVSGDTAPGLLMILFAVLLFSISGVLIKYLGITQHPMAQTVGSLSVALVFYLLLWSFLPSTSFQGIAPSSRAVMAITYLAIGGSLIGFTAYFHILNQLSASTVSLVTLMTPVLALMLGNVLNDESMTLMTLLGAVMIGAGLILYYWGDRLLARVQANG